MRTGTRRAAAALAIAGLMLAGCAVEEPTRPVGQRIDTFDVDPPSQQGQAHAICRDGTLSYSINRQGTCSWHGGVQQWLY